MKTVNDVHLEGLVDLCKVQGEVRGQTVALLSVVTFHPRAGEAGGEGYEKIRHTVRVVAAGAGGDELRRLERELRTEKASGQFDLAVPHPCVVDGCLLDRDGENFVEARNGSFRLVEKMRTQGNNVAKVSGTVSSATFTDGQAQLTVDTAKGKVNVYILRKLNPSAWEEVASRRIDKGNFVTLSGPLLNQEFTDGRKRISHARVLPHSIQKITLKKERNVGPSIG